ncbi:MAG: SDR family oxidoreductase [Deltaproteobacteria bacterium]|nr:SDR family oxidoreductase [Deltaproteobacteria bacterium]
MPEQQTVLLVGGTGRTGRRVLQQLLGRAVRVRAIVRSGRALPPEVAGSPGLTVIEASLLSLSDDEMRRHLVGCDAVISCLGHVLGLKGIFGPPRDLVTRATTRLCRGIEALEPAAPVRFILMSSVSVHRPQGLDSRRGSFERAFLRVLCSVLPPAGDNQEAADFLLGKIGPDNPFVQWAVVRPDSLLEGEVSEYALHEGLVDSLFAPGRTNMANVAHFMSELATNPKTWADWKSRLPVIVNVAASTATGSGPA